MKKLLLWLVTLMLVVSMVATFSLVGCKAAPVAVEGEKVEEEVTTEEEPESEKTMEEAEATKSNEDYKGQVKMWTFLNPQGTSARELALNEIIQNFERDFPNVDIVVEPQQWDLMTAKFLAASQTGEAPDVVWVHPDQLGPVINQGALEPFENLFLKDWSDEDMADVEDGYWNFGVKDGKHHQIGLTRNLYLIYYREDLFNEKGIEAPIETWDEFIEVAKMLTEEDPETGLQRYGFGMPMSDTAADPGLFPALLLYEQGERYTESGEPLWATEAGVRAMKIQTDMVKEHGVTPDSVVYDTTEDAVNDFAAGKYGMIYAISSRMRQIQESAVFDPSVIKMMLLPTYDGVGNSPLIVGGWCIGVWSGGQNKEAAGKFVEFMFNKESDSIWLTVGGQVPTRKSTIEANQEFLSDPLNSFFATVAEGFQYAAFQPTEFSTNGYKDVQARAAQNIIINNMPIMEALEQAEEEFIEINEGN